MLNVSKIYTLFVCYAPAIYVVFPNIYAEVSAVWLLFFAALFAYLVLITQKGSVPLANIWILAIVLLTSVFVFSVGRTDGYSYDWQMIQRLFAQRIVPCLTAIMALSLFHKPRNVLFFIANLFIVSALLSCHAVFQLVADVQLDDDRAIATFQNPNALGLFLVMAVPASVYYFQQRFTRIWVGVLGILVMFAGIFATGSRKGVVALAISAVIFVVFTRFRKRALILIAFGAVAFALIAVSNDALRSRMNIEDLSTRHEMSVVAFNLFQEKPLLGWGHNGYKDRFIDNFPLRQKSLTSHNTYATILADYGLVGFLPFMVLLIYPMRASWIVLVSWRRRSTTTQKAIAGVSIATSIPYAFSLYFMGGSFQMYYQNMVALTIMSFAVCQYRAVANTVTVRHAGSS